MNKILWLCSWYPNEEDAFTGDFIQRHALAVSLRHPIHVLYVHKSLMEHKKIKYTSLQRNPNLQEHIYYVSVSKGVWQKCKWLITYVWLHLQFIQKFGKPHLVHVQIPMKAGLLAWWCKMRWGIPYIVTEHYGIYNPYLADHFKTRPFYFRWLTKWVVKHANCLTTVSKSLGEDMQQWVYNRVYEVVPNVVDTALFFHQERKRQPNFRFIHISNMIPLKNVEGILLAAEKLWEIRKDFCVYFVGRVEPLYYQLAESKNLLNNVVFFVGEVSYREVALQLQQSDALLVFSDTESQSCVVLEALCCGKPAIVTNIGGVKELIHATNGFLVEVRDVAGLVKKMNTMIMQYAQFDTRLISQEAMQKYAYEKVAEDFSSIYIQFLLPA
jgi:glycosyltransferase involved in cell wall biosynthesis